VSEINHVARRVVVHGRVQGVFFRDSCRREAEHYGVTGWVRNAPDGTVEGFFEGPDDAVESLVKWAHDGPSKASVSHLDVTDAAPTGGTEFRVRD
jgi:acylphosphatase